MPQWQGSDRRRTGTGLAPEFEGAAVAHEPVPSDGQTQSMTVGTGRKQGSGELFENFRIDSGPRIRKLDINRGNGATVGSPDPATEIHSRGDGKAVSLAAHGLEGIFPEVQEDLLEPVGISGEFGDRGIVVSLNVDGFRDRIDAEKIEDRVQNPVDVHGAGIQVVSACKDHEFIDQGENSVDFADDELGGLFGASLRGPGHEQFRGTTDSAKWVLDLVGDTGGDVAEGLESVPFGSDFVKLPTHRTVSKGDKGASSVRGFAMESGDGDIGTAKSAVPGLEFDFVGNHWLAVLDGFSDLKKYGVVGVENLIETPSEDGLRRTLQDAAGLGVDFEHLASGSEDHDAIGQRFDNLF